MMTELPKDFKTVRGSMRYSTMDTGDRYVSFGIWPEDWDAAQEGRIVAFIVPAGVGQRHLDQVLGEIRDDGGVRFVVMPRQTGKGAIIAECVVAKPPVARLAGPTQARRIECQPNTVTISSRRKPPKIRSGGTDTTVRD
jgi:hypothetical protein